MWLYILSKLEIAVRHMLNRSAIFWMAIWDTVWKEHGHVNVKKFLMHGSAWEPAIILGNTNVNIATQMQMQRVSQDNTFQSLKTECLRIYYWNMKNIFDIIGIAFNVQLFACKPMKDGNPSFSRNFYWRHICIHRRCTLQLFHPLYLNHCQKKFS